jgi:streptogramin lyase
VSAVSVPFGRSVTALAVAPDGRVWLAASGYSGLLAYDPRSARFDLVPVAGGISVSALATDLAGQIWFVDATNGRLDRYDPATARLSQLALPGGEAFVAARADLRGGLWLGTTSGTIYRLAGDALGRIANVGAPIVSFALAPDGTVDVLAAAAQYTLAGPAGGLLTSAPGGVRSLAVDSAGRLWLADRTQPLFYIAEPR